MPKPQTAAQKIRAKQVKDNFAAFNKMLPQIIGKHRDKYALMRDGEIVGFYKTFGAADRAAEKKFPDRRYSFQEVTDEPIDLGVGSHAAL